MTLRLLPLAILPIPLLLHWLFPGLPLLVFASGAIAVGVLAYWIKTATEQLAARAGSAIGGLLNVSFGSLAELILALFVLLEGEQEVVRAQITGSIIGTGLLGLGLSILAGGLSFEQQKFREARARLLSSLLILVVIALILPAIAHIAGAPGADQEGADERLSLSVSFVLLLLYAGNLVYTLITHRDVFASGEEGQSERGWGLGKSLTVLIAATAAVAYESDLVSGALTATAHSLGLSLRFLGVVVLALIGTSADIFASISFARQNRMGLVMSICIGSAIQMAVVVAPILVILSWLFGEPMNLVFADPIELFAVAGTAFIVNAVAADAETTWFEGMLLVGVYALFGLAFFFR